MVNITLLSLRATVTANLIARGSVETALRTRGRKDLRKHAMSNRAEHPTKKLASGLSPS